MKKKNEVFKFIIENIQEILPTDKQDKFADEMEAKLTEVDIKYNVNELSIKPNGVYFNGEIRPRGNIQLTSHHLTS